jgi:hypothetical protein
MEEKIFPKPAVAGELKKNYIEARLHTDGGPREAENRQLQKQKAKGPANPYYVIIDPRTGEVVRKKAGLLLEQDFLEFLRGP